MQLFGAEPEEQKPPIASENTHELKNKEYAGTHMDICIGCYWYQCDDIFNSIGQPRNLFTS